MYFSFVVWNMFFMSRYFLYQLRKVFEVLNAKFLTKQGDQPVEDQINMVSVKQVQTEAVIKPKPGSPPMCLSNKNSLPLAPTSTQAAKTNSLKIGFLSITQVQNQWIAWWSKEFVTNFVSNTISCVCLQMDQQIAATPRNANSLWSLLSSQSYEFNIHYAREVLGIKETRFNVEKSPPIWRSKNYGKIDPLITAEYKVQGGPIFIGIAR